MVILSRLIYLMVALMMCQYIYACVRKNNELSKALNQVFIFGLGIVASYGISIWINNYMVMSVCHTLLFVCMDWVLYSIIRFVYMYINRPIHRKAERVVMTILAVDNIVMLLNPFTNICMDYKLYEWGSTYILMYQPKFLYHVHLIICYCLVVFVMYLLGRCFVQSPKYYKIKYGAIISILLTVVILNAIFLAFPWTIVDFSTLFYGFAAASMFHATFDFVPNRLVRNLRQFVDDNLYDATLIYDMAGNLLSANRLSREIFSEDDIKSLTDFEKYFGEYKDDDFVERQFGEKIFEVHCQKSRDNKQRVMATVFILHDITRIRHALDRVKHTATHDSLTKIYNRLGFIEEGRRYMSTHKDTVLAIAAVDNFRGINSLYGNEFGDKVLCTIAEELIEYHKSVEMVYSRSAEGKFAVLLPASEIGNFIRYVNQITVSFDEDVEIKLTLHFGYIHIEDTSKPLEFYYERALMAQSQTRNQFDHSIVVYDDKLERALNFEHQLIMDMHTSLLNNEFYFVLQPQVDLKAKKVLGAEALVRWQHGKFGRISPAQFIPLFEKNGFITRVDQYIWENVCKTLRELEDKDLFHGYFSVNVSQVDIMNLDVASLLTSYIKKYNLTPDKLHVEITESACVDNRKLLIDTIVGLQKEGFIVEIDDFGSGYSSLNALTNLPFDTVKLDMKFMENFNKSAKSGIIMNSITNMIHDLQAEIIVEGVETEEQEEQAISLQCHVSQGYLYSRPLEIDDFLKFTNEYNSTTD